MWWIDRWRQSDAFARMTAEEQGLYRNLCDEVVLRADGIIPDDPRILAKASGDHEAWARSGKSVLKSMKKVSGGWTNETAMAVRKESERRSKKQREWRNSRNESGNEKGNAAGNEPDNETRPPEQEKDKYQEQDRKPDTNSRKNQGRSGAGEPRSTPASEPGESAPPVSSSDGKLSPERLGLVFDAGVIQQRNLARDLTALVERDPGPDPRATALEILRAISTTQRGKSIDSLDLRNIPPPWAAVTSHAARKFAHDQGFELPE